MTIGSLFSGIGGLELGLEMAGLGPVRWQAESNPFCRKVLAKHWPGVMRYSDVEEVEGMSGRLKKLSGAEASEAVRLYDAGASCGALGTRYGVSRQSMWELLRRRTVMRSNLRHGADNHFYRGGSYADERAHDLVEKAVARGELKRAEHCECCGKKPDPFADGRSAVQAHHDDYNEPLAVRWLCQPCHHEWHKHNAPVERREVPGKLTQVDLICGGFPIGPVKTSPARERARALLASARDCGVSLPASLARCGLSGSSSKTSPAEQSGGSMPSAMRWNSSTMRRYRSRCQRALSVLRTGEVEFSSLLPTPSASSYGSNRGGAAGRTGKTRYSLQTMARKGLLALPTAKGNQLSPSMSKWPSCAAWQAAHPPGPLLPGFVEWLMGFPIGWTEIGPSETP